MKSHFNFYVVPFLGMWKKIIKILSALRVVYIRRKVLFSPSDTAMKQRYRVTNITPPYGMPCFKPCFKPGSHCREKCRILLNFFYSKYCQLRLQKPEPLLCLTCKHCNNHECMILLFNMLLYNHLCTFLALVDAITCFMLATCLSTVGLVL